MGGNKYFKQLIIISSNITIETPKIGWGPKWVGPQNESYFDQNWSSYISYIYMMRPILDHSFNFQLSFAWLDTITQTAHQFKHCSYCCLLHDKQIK